MPRLIEPGDAPAISLEEAVDTLATTTIDVADEDGIASLGPLLARLGRNHRFLGDLAIAELKDRHQRQRRNSYGAQVMMLHPGDGRFIIRANFWPAQDDPLVRASGPAAFFYGFAHDHNFPFLTYGYAGPGYWSEDYEVADPDAPAPVLISTGRTRLAPGRLMLYRAHRDVHVQHPPEELSVSLNILAQHPGQKWRDQRHYDVANGTVVRAMTTTPSEALVALAVHFGGGNGLDLATTLATRHPSPRMRATAAAALASITAAADPVS